MWSVYVKFFFIIWNSYFWALFIWLYYLWFYISSKRLLFRCWFWLWVYRVSWLASRSPVSGSRPRSAPIASVGSPTRVPITGSRPRPGPPPAVPVPIIVPRSSPAVAIVVSRCSSIVSPVLSLWWPGTGILNFHFFIIDSDWIFFGFVDAVLHVVFFSEPDKSEASALTGVSMFWDINVANFTEFAEFFSKFVFFAIVWKFVSDSDGE